VHPPPPSTHTMQTSVGINGGRVAMCKICMGFRQNPTPLCRTTRTRPGPRAIRRCCGASSRACPCASPARSSASPPTVDFTLRSQHLDPAAWCLASIVISHSVPGCWASVQQPSCTSQALSIAFAQQEAAPKWQVWDGRMWACRQDSMSLCFTLNSALPVAAATRSPSVRTRGCTASLQPP